MSAQELKQAIRDSHEVIRHGEFCGNVIRTRDLELLELYLDSEPAARMTSTSAASLPGLGRRRWSASWRGLDPNQTDWLGKSLLQHSRRERRPAGGRGFLGRRR